jgi:hypothetical protein
MRNRLPLQCIRRKQGIRGRGADHAGQLPRKVMSILKTRVEAESARGRELVGCIAGQENAALWSGFGVARLELGQLVFCACGVHGFGADANMACRPGSAAGSFSGKFQQSWSQAVPHPGPGK